MKKKKEKEREKEKFKSYPSLSSSSSSPNNAKRSAPDKAQFLFSDIFNRILEIAANLVLIIGGHAYREREVRIGLYYEISDFRWESRLKLNLIK